MLSISRQGTWIDPSGYTWSFYGDDVDRSVFTIIPRPEFATDPVTGKPIFALVEFETSDGGNGSGYCALQTRTNVPEEAILGITSEIQFRFGVQQPRFVTLSLNPATRAVIEYVDPELAVPVLVEIAPSRTDQNSAAFLIPLTRGGMQQFKGAFSGQSGSVPISYWLYTDVRLPDVGATVTFDSVVAEQYERSEQIDKNIWGEVTRRQVAIAHYFSRSQAGTIELHVGDPPPPVEIVEQMRRWAENTLEDLVELAVDSALSRIPPDRPDAFTISMVSSFRREYMQGQIAQWVFVPTDTLPSMPALGFSFDEFFTRVKARQFTVNVTMNVSFEPPESDAFVEEESIASVEVTIRYPTLFDNTLRFDALTQSHLFVAPWDEGAGGRYTLEYTVNYHKPGQPPLRVRFENLEQSVFTVTPASAGVISVEFDGRNLDWVDPDSGYSGVEIAFFFIDLSGDNQPVTQIARIDREAPRTTIRSLFSLPIFNDYSYTLTYFMNDGTTFTLDARRSNAARIFVNNPLQSSTLFVVLQQPPGFTILQAPIRVSWLSGLSHDPVSKNLTLLPSKPVTPVPVNAVSTSQVLFSYQGTILLQNLPPKTIVLATTPNMQIVISPVMIWFGIQIDASLIDWVDNLGLVKIDLTYMDGTVPRIFGSPLWAAPDEQKDPLLVVAGFYVRGDVTPTYDYTITWSYTDKPAETRTVLGATGATVVIPARPDVAAAPRVESYG
ncbi:MAG TPA: hypothetical protein VF266_16960 [Thermoanaerobaculia bacterium]